MHVDHLVLVSIVSIFYFILIILNGDFHKKNTFKCYYYNYWELGINLNGSKKDKFYLSKNNNYSINNR